MAYLDQCRYKERNDPVKGHVYDFTGPCFVCKKPTTVTVIGPELYQYRQGAYMQDAFSNPPAEREFLISGTCGPCFDDLFKEETDQ